MSRPFKSVFEGALTINPSDGQSIGIETTGNFLAFKLEEVPSLMLALGEAAGVVPKWDENGTAGTPEHLAHIQWHLQRYVDAQAVIAAQAEEATKLEAEALELYNSYRKESNYHTLNSWKGSELNREMWLAVARKAREIDN